jgi:hypothetical protein
VGSPTGKGRPVDTMLVRWLDTVKRFEGERAMRSRDTTRSGGRRSILDIPRSAHQFGGPRVLGGAVPQPAGRTSSFDWFTSGAISRDGLYVAFTSTATNLVTDTNDAKDVFEQRVN